MTPIMQEDNLMYNSSLFGCMRDATPEEQKFVTDYILSIAVDTGINFDTIINDKKDVNTR